MSWEKINKNFDWLLNQNDLEQNAETVGDLSGLPKDEICDMGIDEHDELCKINARKMCHAFAGVSVINALHLNKLEKVTLQDPKYVGEELEGYKYTVEKFVKKENIGKRGNPFEKMQDVIGISFSKEYTGAEANCSLGNGHPIEVLNKINKYALVIAKPKDVTNPLNHVFIITRINKEGENDSNKKYKNTDIGNIHLINVWNGSVYIWTAKSNPFNTLISASNKEYIPVSMQIYWRKDSK